MYVISINCANIYTQNFILEEMNYTQNDNSLLKKKKKKANNQWTAYSVFYLKSYLSGRK